MPEARREQWSQRHAFRIVVGNATPSDARAPDSQPRSLRLYPARRCAALGLVALAETGPLTLTALRYVVAVLCFASVLTGHRIPAARALMRMAGLGALGIGIGQVNQALGVQRANASVATIISALIPLLLVVFAVLRLRQRILPVHVLGLLLAIVGVALVAGGGSEGTPGVGLTGEALVLVSVISIALSYVMLADVMLAELTAAHGAAVVSAWSSLAGAILLLPAAAWEVAATPRWPGPVGIAVVVYLGALVSAAGLWIWLYLLRVLPARIAAGAQYSQPLAGVGASALLFGDMLGMPFAIGTALVLGGVILTTLPMKRQSQASGRTFRPHSETDTNWRVQYPRQIQRSQCKRLALATVARWPARA